MEGQVLLWEFVQVFGGVGFRLLFRALGSLAVGLSGLGFCFGVGVLFTFRSPSRAV